MPKFDIVSAISKLRRWAGVNEDMGRVVDGQVELMRALADNMEAGHRPAGGLANELDDRAELLASGAAIDPKEIAELLKTAAATLRFGHDAVVDDLAIKARLGGLGEAAKYDGELYDALRGLRSAGALPADGVPRPITEAPQDGTPILAVVDGKPSVIRFFEPWGNWQHSSVDFSTIDVDKDEYFGIGRLVPTAWIDVPRQLLEAELVVAHEGGMAHGLR